jgi:long-chain acyl-CoA synthetase
MVHDLAEAGTGPFDKVHSVVVSGARMEPRHWQAARRLFPRARVSEVYGASELSFVTVATDERDTGLGRAGRPFPGVEIQIRPFETGTDGEQLNAAESEPGLVFARSPYLFDGYLENSEITSPVGGDGFMTVGDVGVLGPGGLSLTARASNLLITGGKNVYPEEVEAALSRHRSVSESVVVGLPHERWGEELAAFLVPGERGDAPDPVELRAYLAGEIARYKIPKRWFTVAAIPRTPAGKLDRSAERLFADGEEL